MPETSRRPAAIESILAEHGRLVESALDKYLPWESAPPAEVHRAMRYSVFAGGKRPRQTLVIMAAEIAGARSETVLPSAWACLTIGATLAGADDADLRALDRYGEHVGLAFQIIDDILDVVGESGKLGKGTGADAWHSKVTFPAVFGLERSRRLAANATQDAAQALAPLGVRGGRLADLAIYLLERDP